MFNLSKLFVTSSVCLDCLSDTSRSEDSKIENVAGKHEDTSRSYEVHSGQVLFWFICFWAIRGQLRMSFLEVHVVCIQTQDPAAVNSMGCVWFNVLSSQRVCQSVRAFTCCFVPEGSMRESVLLFDQNVCSVGLLLIMPDSVCKSFVFLVVIYLTACHLDPSLPAEHPWSFTWWEAKLLGRIKFLGRCRFRCHIFEMPSSTMSGSRWKVSLDIWCNLWFAWSVVW